MATRPDHESRCRQGSRVAGFFGEAVYERDAMTGSVSDSGSTVHNAERCRMPKDVEFRHECPACAGHFAIGGIEGVCRTHCPCSWSNPKIDDLPS